MLQNTAVKSVFINQRVRIGAVPKLLWLKSHSEGYSRPSILFFSKSTSSPLLPVVPFWVIFLLPFSVGNLSVLPVTAGMLYCSWGTQ